MNLTLCTDRLRLALRTLSTDGRLVRVPVWLLAIVAGMTPTEARYSLRALDRADVLYIVRLPLANDAACMVLIRPPWPLR